MTPAMRARLWTALRLGLAALLLGLLFRSVSFGAALRAARDADLRLFVPAVLAVALIGFWADAATLSYAVTRFHAPFSGREARSLYAWVRVVNTIHWGLGLTAMMLYLRRRKGVALADFTSTTLFCSTIDATVKTGLGLLGLAVRFEDPVLLRLAWLLAIVWAGHVLVLACTMTGRPRWRWAQPLLRTPKQARVRDLLVILLLQALGVCSFAVFMWVALQAFAVHAPLLQVLATVPLVLIVGGLPITPAGLGTQQAAMLYLYGAYGTQADILACGLLFPVAFLLVRLMLGAWYARDAVRLQHETAGDTGDATAGS